MVPEKIREYGRVYWRQALGAALFFALGLSVGYRLYRPKPVTAKEAFAPEIRQKDGSLVLTRDPNAKVPGPPKVIPKGAEVIRSAQVLYLPTGVTPGSRLPDEIDLHLMKMPDGTERILAESPTGTIVGGMDIPRKPATPDLKWAAGGMYGPVQKTYGVFVDRDLGPWRVGLEVTQTQLQGLRSVDIWVKVGLRF
jgi:hypothetical protein